LSFLKVATQEQKNGLAGIDGTRHIALKNASGTRGIAMEIYRRVLVIVRRRYARGKILLQIAPTRVEHG
jgi:hypothetical protein